MSLRGCVICVTGDLSEDAFVPHSWTEAKIENFLHDRKIKFVRKVDKTVTHLVCSRSAFLNNAPEGNVANTPHSRSP